MALIKNFNIINITKAWIRNIKYHRDCRTLYCRLMYEASHKISPHTEHCTSNNCDIIFNYEMMLISFINLMNTFAKPHVKRLTIRTPEARPRLVYLVGLLHCNKHWRLSANVFAWGFTMLLMKNFNTISLEQPVASDFVTKWFRHSDFVTNDYVTDGILSTEKTEQAYLLTILYYHCIKIKVLTKNSSH